VKEIRTQQKDGRKTLEITKGVKNGKNTRRYNDVIVRCGIQGVPWYVIPSNKKWFRNSIIAKIICETLKDL
jgi:polyphosphate kinase 2 (PPK2 family)